eukprot:gene7348-54141_t
MGAASKARVDRRAEMVLRRKQRADAIASLLRDECAARCDAVISTLRGTENVIHRADARFRTACSADYATGRAVLRAAYFASWRTARRREAERLEYERTQRADMEEHEDELRWLPEAEWGEHHANLRAHER